MTRICVLSSDRALNARTTSFSIPGTCIGIMNESTMICDGHVVTECNGPLPHRGHALHARLTPPTTPITCRHARLTTLRAGWESLNQIWLMNTSRRTGKTSQEVTHPVTTPWKACLITEFPSTCPLLKELANC